MQTIKKSKIFLSVLFLAALFFVDCSFEDKLGSEVQDSQISEGKKTNLPIWDKGYHRNEISDGSYIPTIYFGKYGRNDDTGIDSWVNAGNDINGAYISVRGGTKEYIKNFEYLGKNTWRHVYGSDNGKHRVTEQHAFKFEQNKRILISIYIDVDPDGTLSNHYVYIHDKDINK